MPTFKVRRRVEAYVDYVADVEANSPEDAAAVAREREEDYDWEEEGSCEFDARQFIALDAHGNEIDGTQCGDL